MVFNVDQAIFSMNKVEMKFVTSDSINKFDYKFLKIDENLLRVRLKRNNVKDSKYDDDASEDGEEA
jgi:hypothetical protein